jgi:hypothetical protein
LGRLNLRPKSTLQTKQIGLFLDQENSILKSMVEKIEESGANVLLGQI